MAAIGTALRYTVASTLLGIAGYSVATTVVLLVEGPTKPDFQTGTIDARSDNKQSRVDPTKDEIGKWRLFGAFSPDQVRGDRVTQAPDTKLNLSLMGIFHADGTQDGWAIIVQDENVPELVKPGEHLRGLEIAHVLRDRVILDRNGRLEQLMLTTFDDLDVTEIAAAPAPTQERISHAKPSDNLSDRELLLKRNGLEPVSDNRASGYRVTDNATRLQKQFNLQKDDIILSVNGYSIGSAAEDEMAYQSFRQSGVAQFSIQRDGTTFMKEYKP